MGFILVLQEFGRSVNAPPKVTWVSLVRRRGALDLPWPTLSAWPGYGLVRTRLDFDELLARRAVEAGATLWERSPGKPDSSEPARLEIAFEGGLPVSVNGVPMTLTELIESVATIAEAPAAVVFQAAHEALGADASRVSGATVCLELFKGRHRVLSAHHS